MSDPIDLAARRRIHRSRLRSHEREWRKRCPDGADTDVRLLALWSYQHSRAVLEQMISRLPTEVAAGRWPTPPITPAILAAEARAREGRPAPVGDQRPISSR